MAELKIIEKGVRAKIEFPSQEKGSSKKFISALTRTCQEKGWSFSKMKAASPGMVIEIFGLSAQEFIEFFNDWLIEAYKKANSEIVCG